MKLYRTTNPTTFYVTENCEKFDRITVPFRFLQPNFKMKNENL